MSFPFRFPAALRHRQQEDRHKRDVLDSTGNSHFIVYLLLVQHVFSFIAYF